MGLLAPVLGAAFMAGRPNRNVAVLEVANTVVDSPAPGLGVPRAGTYRYAISGDAMTSLSGLRPIDDMGSLTIQEPVGSEQEIVRVDATGTTAWTVRHADDGMYLTRMAWSTPTYTIELRPVEPAPVLLTNQPVGRTWSWQSTSVDGATTVDATFTVARIDEIVAGEPTVVIDVVFALRGAVEGQVQQLLWHAASDGRVVRLRESAAGRAGSTAFRSDLRWTLEPTESPS